MQPNDPPASLPDSRPAYDFAEPGTWDAASASSLAITDLSALALAIRRARRHAKLSQRALAAKAGIAPSTIMRIERANGDTGIETVLRLLAAAGVRLEVTGLEPTSFPYGLIEDKRDNANRRAPPHRLSEAGYGYWDHTVSHAMIRAREEARAENDVLGAINRVRTAGRDTQRREARRSDDTPAP